MAPGPRRHSAATGASRPGRVHRSTRSGTPPITAPSCAIPTATASKRSAVSRPEADMRTGQPSQTARGAAAYRAIHQTLEGGVIFTDPFAVRIIDEKARATLDEVAADPMLRPMRLFIAARSRFSEDALAHSVARGVQQVVGLGA